MCSDVVIAVHGLGKTYHAYAHPAHALLARVSGGRVGHPKEFHALRDVSFEVRKGESVGIVGKNGSGKSTLLQLICGIRKATSGVVAVSGRVSALLELGSGFHPELTGRENVFLQGAIIGLTREEMEARYDDIVAFADIGDYIEQPVKTYSSGMFVRLAFATAISVNPEILLVDEALSVGDSAFQIKCMNKMQDLIDSGVSMLFVSHNAYQIQRMCNRAIYLSQGSIRKDGPSFEVMASYESEISGDSRPAEGSQSLNPGFRLLSVACELRGASAEQGTALIREGQDFSVRISYESADNLDAGLQIGLLLKNFDGTRIFGLTSKFDGVRLPCTRGTHMARVRFAPNLLLAGNYTISLSAFDIAYSQQYAFWDHALALRIESTKTNALERIGSVALPHEWILEPIEANANNHGPSA